MKNLFLSLTLVLCHWSLAQVRTYDTLPNLPDHYVKRFELFKKEPKVQGRVIMVGNSITEGGDWKSLLHDSTIVNRGISGDVTFGVLNRLNEITDQKPSKIFLLIGINDVSRNTPDEVIIANTLLIVLRIREASPSTEIFLQSILPTNDTFKNLHENFVGKGARIRRINEQLAKYSATLKYVYIDLHSNFIDANGSMETKYATDGLHLSTVGYQHWVEVLKKGKYL
jgi:lysophospholipase L1-like esterase